MYHLLLHFHTLVICTVIICQYGAVSTTFYNLHKMKEGSAVCFIMQTWEWRYSSMLIAYETSGCRWRDNIKLYLKNCSIEWIWVPQNPVIPYTVGIFLTRGVTVYFSRRTLLINIMDVTVYKNE